MVPVEEIRSNDYDLSINKYKKTEYVAVEYPPTAEILDAIDRLNAEIEKETRELRVLLNK
jgi:type I restriction enzyme M protein